ncbi:MAG: hypothetical protein EOO24_31850 [Comamonadaceae bacterium]|nr:MAG: hypothetical protein EOO24_31850 [Comamonadaceae bacterium]
MPRLDSRLDEFRAVLEQQGLQQALAVLNRDVPHRYSAVYRLTGALLRNHLLFDKQGEISPDFLKVVPFDSSFCQFVFREGVFNTDDSSLDNRLADHPYQGVVISYTGVPIVDTLGGGEIVGSLCHFDLVRHTLDDDAFEILQRASRLLTPSMLGA